MTTLVIDTSLHVAQAALFEDNILTAHAQKQGEKGQTDMLLPVLRGVMQGRAWQELSDIVVTTGPGVFTGIRAGIAAARALKLALCIPVRGVSTLDVLRVQMDADLALIDAHKGEAYAHAGHEPMLLKIENLGSLANLARRIAVYPSALEATLPSLEEAGYFGVQRLEPAAILKAAHLFASEALPLYVRAPDALPQAGKALARQVPQNA